MAFGDIGGVITELIITCKTPATGDVAISKGDAVALTDNYTVTNATSAEDALFGQALAGATGNGQHLPVKVRGVCTFAYTGTAPTVDGAAGLAASDTAGSVKAPASGNGKGVNLNVDTTASEVHVLL